MELIAICVTTHLTLFTLADESEAAQLLEDKVEALSQRVAALSGVNLLDGSAHVNWPILAIFGGVTLLFLVAVGVSKLLSARRKDAVDGARLVFLRLGVLARPQVRVVVWL